jgi:membrane fusion protein (multidrug efflux system)
MNKIVEHATQHPENRDSRSVQDKSSEDAHTEHSGDPADDDHHDHEEKNRTTGNERDGGKQKLSKHKPILIAVAIVLVAVTGGLLYWIMNRNQESTDDAYTEGNAISIASKVSGYVIENQINDNVRVKAGDLLVKIDPRDYLSARDRAQSELDASIAQLTSDEIDLEVTHVRAPANLAEARAQLMQTRANLSQAESDFNRQRAVDPRATTQTTVDQATAALSSNAANLKAARARVTVASLVDQTIRSAEAVVEQRKAQVEEARANLSQAELNLSYTEVRAPQDGLITERNVNLGTFAQAGQQVFYLVTRDIWITANFKETQLDRMRIGQRVEVEVDAYSHLKLSGHIDSIQAGSGARFTAFPAENATGNFVKIVRRVPVKILIDRGLEQGSFLPLGLSVQPRVYLR